MKVVVHGTKGGYRVLFKTQGAPSIGSDIRNNVSSEAALGKSAYSIGFAANGCVFTKYIILRDTLRSDATGFIAFSLFLFFNEELSGKGSDVKSILDELSNHYVDKYVKNNSINKGETIIIQEDWSFVNSVLGRRTVQVKEQNNLEILPGIKDAAFVLYKDDHELMEYLSKPFQEEYNGYKQILLFNSALISNSTDLLNVLRNSGVELKVDLKNETFFLNNYNRSRGVTITANGKPRSEGKNNNVIRAKEKIEIKYQKDYYKSIMVTGTLSNPDSDIYRYLEKRGNQIIIKHDVLSTSLNPIEKIITFNIKDWAGNSVFDAKITVKNANDEKPVTFNNQVTFKGEELGKRWTVSASNNRFYSEEGQIDFAKDGPENTGIIDIFLNKHQLNINKQQVIVLDESNEDFLYDATLSKTVFTGGEINETHKIIVQCSGYDMNSFEYCPATDAGRIPPINLKKKQYSRGAITTPSFTVSPGNNGTLKGGYSYTSNRKDGSDVKHLIIPNKGYKFNNRFEVQGNTLIAQYEKDEPFYQNPKIIAAIIVLAMAIGFGIWAFFSLSGNDQLVQPDQPQQPTAQHIEAYIKGNSLILDTLNSYKNIPDLEQNKLSGKLDSAIKKREFINAWNFYELKILFFYPAQQKFQNAIRNIDSARYNDIKYKFSNISAWSLDQIADSINAVLNDSKPTTEKKTEVIKEELQNKKVTQPPKPEQKKEEKQDLLPANNNHPKEITKELQSGTVTRDELQSWKNAGMDKNKRSIDLYLKFWSVINSGQKDDFDKLLKEVKNDPILKNSELKNFLISICASSDAFEKFKNTSGKSICKTIAELKMKVK